MSRAAYGPVANAAPPRPDAPGANAVDDFCSERQPEGMAKVYSPKVFQALADSLSTVYWYTQDLKSFMIRCGVSSARVATLDWTYKRTAVRELLDELAAQGPSATNLVKALVGAIVEQDRRFQHLARVTGKGDKKIDGNALVMQARAAVNELKALVGDQTVADLAEAARAAHRTEAERHRVEKAARADALANMKHRFHQLEAMTQPQPAWSRFSAMASRSIQPSRP